jgi:hypothetical protein
MEQGYGREIWRGGYACRKQNQPAFQQAEIWKNDMAAINPTGNLLAHQRGGSELSGPQKY